jgi:hypothetical protein
LTNNLQNVTSTLHELIKTLPAIQTHCSAEVIKRHLQLIAYFQQQYDRLAANPSSSPSPA